MRNYNKKSNYSEPHLDFAALHLVVASRQIDFQSKVFVHAGMIHTFAENLLGSE